MVTLYTNDCPRCKVLKAKLDADGYEYEVSNDFKKVVQAGFRSAPVLEIDGAMFGFEEAMGYIIMRGDSI